MLLKKHGEDRVLVREVLVEGTDRDPDLLRDAIGRGAGIAALPQTRAPGLDDLSFGEARPVLGRLFSRAYGVLGGDDWCS
jgi:hypothetical protein